MADEDPRGTDTEARPDENNADGPTDTSHGNGEPVALVASRGAAQSSIVW
jgi:hypothetical protein